MKKETTEIFIKKRFAEIREIKNLRNINQNGLRIWRSGHPTEFTLQIRTYNRLVTKGKERNMIANVEVSLDELKEIVKQAEYCTKHNTFYAPKKVDGVDIFSTDYYKKS